jgi:hypothetical protein
METCCKLFTNKTLQEKCAPRAIHKPIVIAQSCQIFFFDLAGQDATFYIY